MRRSSETSLHGPGEGVVGAGLETRPYPAANRHARDRGLHLCRHWRMLCELKKRHRCTMALSGKTRIGFMLLLAAAMLALPRVACPQQNRCTEESVLAAVAQPDGSPVFGFGKSNLRAKIHRNTLPILSVTPWSGPARVVLLFDLSGSMTGDANFLPLERAIGLEIMRQAPANVSFAMAVFSSRTKVVAPFSTSFTNVEDDVENLGRISSDLPQKKRTTALFDAIQTSIGMFGSPHPGDAICLFSDGVDNASQSSKKQAERSLLAGGIRMFAIDLSGPAPERVRMPQVAEGAANLHDLVDVTGGRRLELPWPMMANLEGESKPPHWSGPAPGMPKEFDWRLVRGYKVTVALPPGLEKPEGWKLEVVNQEGKANHHLAVIYPRLSPCETSP